MNYKKYLSDLLTQYMRSNDVYFLPESKQRAIRKKLHKIVDTFTGSTRADAIAAADKMLKIVNEI